VSATSKSTRNAAGAIGSPQLLPLSGIGSAALLARHGIGVVHELPGVGESLQDHLKIRAVFGVSGAITLNMMADSGAGKVCIGLQCLLTRRGPMSMAPSQLVKPGGQYGFDDDLAKLAGDIGTTNFHPVATCRMGRDRNPLAGLDSRLAVRGIAQLTVADASAMPTIASGNTNAPTLMMAERAAHWLRGRDGSAV